MLPRTHIHIVRHAGFPKDFRDGAAVTEGVHIVAGMGGYAEFFLKVALGDQRMPGQAFPAGNVAVRLNPPAAHQLPAALLHPLLNLPEHFRFSLLDPFVIGPRRAGKHEIRVFIHPVQHRTEGGANLAEAVSPAPEPHRIDVGVSNHIQRFFHGCYLLMRRAMPSPDSQGIIRRSETGFLLSFFNFHQFYSKLFT